MNLAPLLVIAALTTFFVAVLFLLLFRRLTSPNRHTTVEPGWLHGFSVIKYRPMLRLLAEADYQFLETQEGYTPSIARRLRAERRKIFRQYLGCMRADFSRLEAALRLYLVASYADRPDLAKALLKRRLVFTYGLLAVECRLALHGLGIGTVDIRGLVGSLDAMRAQLGQFALAGQAAVA